MAIIRILAWMSFRRHPGAPTLVFFHGGYWRSNRKEDFAFLAPPLFDAGVSLVLTGYPLAPSVSVGEIAGCAKVALGWVQANLARWGGAGVVGGLMIPTGDSVVVISATLATRDRVLLRPTTINDERYLRCRVQYRQFFDLNSAGTRMAAAQDEPSLIVQAGIAYPDVTLTPHPPAEVDFELRPAAAQAHRPPGLFENKHQVELRLQNRPRPPADSDAPAAGAP
jgi:hypothetical protein